MGNCLCIVSPHEACVGERCGELRGSMLEAWMKSYKSEVAIT